MQFITAQETSSPPGVSLNHLSRPVNKVKKLFRERLVVTQ